MSNIKNLISNNQSIWLDSISKQMLDSGDLSKIIDLGITGITSNPSIFDKAISSSEVYDETIREISNNISDPKEYTYNELLRWQKAKWVFPIPVFAVKMLYYLGKFMNSTFLKENNLSRKYH